MSPASAAVVLIHDKVAVNNLFAEEAQELSTRLSLPIMTTDEWRSSITLEQQPVDELAEAKVGSNDLTNQQQEKQSPLFLLRLVPCHELSHIQQEHQPLLADTYALTLEEVSSIEKEPLSRRQNRSRKRKKNQFRLSSTPFFVDLTPGKRQRSSSSEAPDLLVQATKVGGSSQQGITVYDVTAGWGQDSLVLATAASPVSKVVMIERDPLVGVLLQDGLRRLQWVADKVSSLPAATTRVAQQERQRVVELSETLSFEAGDGTTVLENKSRGSIDVIYLDPMFPPRSKKAAVKKGMALLHGLLETQTKQNDEASDRQQQDRHRCEEERRLLSAALDAANVRVVVKRPIRAPLLGCDDDSDYSPVLDASTTLLPRPSYVVKGSVNRWDVYLTKKNET